MHAENDSERKLDAEKAGYSSARMHSEVVQREYLLLVRIHSDRGCTKPKAGAKIRPGMPSETQSDES